MDEEEHHVEVQREGSAAGLLAVVFLVFLTGAALIVGLRSGLSFSLFPLHRHLRSTLSRTHRLHQARKR